jgi:glutathione S-transferase
MDKPLLYIANRNYSSWSLRAWLALRWSGLEFTEQLVDLDQPGYGEQSVAQVLAITGTGKLPALVLRTESGSQVVSDSLAIAEWAHDSAPQAALLPSDPLLRARVRSAIAEMHSGFSAVRRELTMNIRRRCRAHGLGAGTQREIARLVQIFVSLRSEFGASGLVSRSAGAQTGPWLFGARTLADAFFTPIATRFRTYGIDVAPLAQAYCDTLLSDPDFLDWERKVLAETHTPFSRANFDALYV